MPRPKSPHPKARTTIVFRQETLARVLLLIANPDHSYGFAQGALSAFVEAAVVEKLDRLRHANQEPAKALPSV
jgi:hypothetical protein